MCMMMWAVLLAPTVALRAAVVASNDCQSPFNNMACTALQQMSLPGHPAAVESPDIIVMNGDGDCVAWLAANASNYDFVGLVGFQYEACAAEAVANYTSTNFAIIDSSPAGGAAGPNMVSALFREQEPSFAAGYLAGLVTQAKVLGIIAGAPFTPVQRLYNGFQLGVKAACPDCVIEGKYIYGFANGQDGGSNFGRYLVEERGVDVVFGCGGWTGSAGILEAARLGSFVVGVDVDEYLSTFAAEPLEVQNRLLTSAKKNVGQALYLAEEMFRKDNVAMTLWLDYSNEGVALSGCHEACGVVTAGVRSQVEAVEIALALGQQHINVDGGSGGIPPLPSSAAPNTWYEVAPFSRTPAGRVQFTAAPFTDPFGLKQYIALYGGLDALGQPLGELLVFDVTSQTWMKSEAGSLAVGDPPPVLAEACVVSLPNDFGDFQSWQIFIVGGRDAARDNNENLYSWTPMPYWYPHYDTWATVATTGDAPTGRTGPSCARKGSHEFLVFSGRTGATSDSNTYQFDRRTGVWSLLAVGQPQPPVRWAAGSAVGRVLGEDCFIVAAGKDAAVNLQDVWALSLTTLTWRQLAPLPQALRFAPLVEFVDTGAEGEDPLLVVWPMEMLGSFELDGRQYAEGGYALVYDANLNKWAAQQQGGAPREQAAGVILGNRAWALGGQDEDGLAMLARGSDFLLQPVCAAGQFFDGRRCSPCGVGTYSPNEGFTACLECPPGQFANAEGHVQCDLCAIGFEQPAPGSTGCSACPEGTYAEVAASQTCTPCRPGTASKDGPCTACPVGSYQESSGMAECTPCNEGETTKFPGAMVASECGCAPGSYTSPAGCILCTGDYLMSLDCTGFANPPTSKETFMVTLEGDQDVAPFTISKLYRCTTPEACPGGPAGTCGIGLDSTKPACGQCKVDWFSQKGVCAMCTGSGGEIVGPLLLTLAIICAPIILVGCYIVCNSPLTARTSTALAASLSIGSGITAFQMMGTFELFSIEWPGFLPNFLAFFQLFMFDFDVIRWECALTPSMLVKYFVRAILPALIVLSYFFLYILSSVIGKPLLKTKVINSTGTLLQVLFMSISMNSFVPFQCYGHMFPSDEQSMLKYPAVICSLGEHSSMVGMGVVAVLFTLTMLGSVVYLTVAAPRLTANDTVFLLKYKFLFFRFRSDRYYFNSVFLMRNFMIGLTPALATNDAAIQTIILMCVTGSALCIQMYMWPWREWSLNLLDAIILSSMGLICGCAMAILTPSFFQKDSVHIMVQVFAVLQVVSISVFVGQALYQLIIYRNQIVITDAHKAFTEKLCSELRELAEEKIVAIPRADQAYTFANLPDYDLANLREAIGLLNKVYGREDSSTTGTKRINLGIRTIIQSVHKTSLEGQKMPSN